MPGPSKESAKGVKEIPRELPLPWDDSETVMNMFLKHGDQVNVVYEDHANPQIRKLEISLRVVNKEIQVSHTCVGIHSILVVCVIRSMVGYDAHRRTLASIAGMSGAHIQGE